MGSQRWDDGVMNVARIKDGVVVNLEVADQAWITENDGVDGYTFIPYVLDVPEVERSTAPPSPVIGLGFDPVTGLFEQSPLQEESHE